MHTEAQAGSTQCMHWAFMKEVRPSSPLYSLMMFFVFEFRSSGASYMAPRSVPESGGIPFASLHFTTHAWQPMHRVASYSSPTASGGGIFFGRGPAKASGAPVAAKVAAEAIPLRTERRVGDMLFRLLVVLSFSLSLRRPELFGGHRARPDQGPDRQAGDPDSGYAYAAVVRMDGRVGVGRGRTVDFDGRVQRHAERQRLLGAAEAGVADSHRPRPHDLVEMLQGAGGVCPGPLAACLVEAVPVPVPLVTEPFDEPAGVEVRTSRAILVDGARVREGGPPEAVEGGQGPEGRVLEHRTEEIVRIRGASRETHDRLPFENPGNPHGAGRVRVGRRNAAPGCAGADRDDRARLSADLLRDLHGRPPADPAIGADLRAGDRTLDHAHELAGVLPDGGLQRLLRLGPGRREQGLVVIEGHQVKDEIRHGG